MTPAPDPTDYITAHFRLSEFAVSASHPELVEPVPEAYVPHVIKLVTAVLEPIRAAWGHSLLVDSGYRSAALNKAVGGSPTSQHCLAEAADITTTDVRGLFCKLLTRAYAVPCGQVIYYPRQNFIHVALPSPHYPTPTFFVNRVPKRYEPVSSVEALAAKGV
jgi:hypothetical protein